MTRRLALAACLSAACSSSDAAPDGGTACPCDAPIFDGPVIDASVDAGADAEVPDAPVDAAPDAQPGDSAELRDVVINEANWFGNTADSNDEWIELRNTTAAALNLHGWTLDNGGTANLTLPPDTILDAGAYLVVAREQGPDADGQRTSLTGVTGVLLLPVDLVNGGEQLTLRDVDGDVVDQTPAGAWPAGDNTLDRAMERRDELTGGGYTDGTQASAWYSWRDDDSDTTHTDSSDHGTPGAANGAPPQILHATGFETSDPVWVELSGNGALSNTPPAGTAARTGTGVLSVDSITTNYTGRQIQSETCVPAASAIAPIAARIWATASTANGGNVLTARIKLLWFTDAACTTAHATASSVGAGATVPAGSYLEIIADLVPPAGATHLKVRFEVHDDNGTPNDGDDWAADDVLIMQ